MTVINKQKFLAELGKLLTFMYEEDRQRALAMYSWMFDDAADEQMLLHALVSPTKQAVIVARAYNSNLGKLSVYSEYKAAPEDKDENGVPDYVQAIEAVRDEALAAQSEKIAAMQQSAAADEPEDGQISLFGEDDTAEDAPAEEKPAEVEREEDAPAEPNPAEEAPAEETPAEEMPAEEAPAEETPIDEPDAAETPAEEMPVKTEPEPEEEKPQAEEEPEITFFTMPKEGTETPPSEGGAKDLDADSFNIDVEPVKTRRRKPKVLLLILFIILAIPIAIAGIVLLLIPALLCLAISIGAIICGVVLVSAAFQGLVMLADIMVVLGVALVLLALGLLFLWMSIWFIGGAMAGMIHGIVSLGEKWCYKEVLV